MKIKLLLFGIILFILTSGCNTLKVAERAVDGGPQQTETEKMSGKQNFGPVSDIKDAKDVLKYNPDQFERSWEIW